MNLSSTIWETKKTYQLITLQDADTRKLNGYTRKKESGEIGKFPFHIDIAPNGEITAILPEGAPATLDMKLPSQWDNPPFPLSETIHSGTLVLFSGESRWKWQLRVTPIDVASSDQLARISLVVGCSRA